MASKSTFDTASFIFEVKVSRWRFALGERPITMSAFHDYFSFIYISVIITIHTMSASRTPGSMRGAQIGLGVVAIILSILVVAHPGITLVTITIVLAITLMVVGIFEIISGIFAMGTNRSRWGSVGLGVLALFISGMALTFPISAIAFVIVLFAVALLFIGIADIVRGVGDKYSSGWVRAFNIGAGALAIVLSGFVMFSPLYGAILLSLMLGIALLIIGIQIIVSGISGRSVISRGMER
jgi:uncharacterized membrane protein HdeD (DUF308 family)